MIIHSIEELKAWAFEFVGQLPKNATIVLEGEMGAGKTTLTGFLCEALGVTDQVSSPTYSIVQEYLTAEPIKTVLHFDLYRLKSIDEALHAGIIDLLDREDTYRVIEWHQLVADYLPMDTIFIQINLLENNDREIILS